MSRFSKVSILSWQQLVVMSIIAEMDDLITTDGLIANDWFDRSLVQDLRELIIVSARQSRSLLDTQKAQTTWYLCTEFSLFFVKNLHYDDPSGKIKTTLLFSN